MPEKTDAVYVDIKNKQIQKLIKNWLYIGFATIFLFVINLIQINKNIGYVLWMKIFLIIQAILIVIAVVNFIKLRKLLKTMKGET